YSLDALNIIMPLGLSFHTFQSMSYTIEVYRGKQQPERRFEILALYVLFYPQLVAGPIERPQSLLRQLREHHNFDYDQIVSGLKLMAWGFFQKMVIADAIATITGPVFAAPDAYHGLSLSIATVLFSVQIFCDFAGYSDIAIGSAQVIGFRLSTNFRQPFLATSVAVFWSRWHISLSSWFRDYLYMPACRKWDRPMQRNLASIGIFALIGLWHGASWTFIIWGVFNGSVMVMSKLTRSFRKGLATRTGLTRRPRLHTLVQIVLTFFAVNIPGVFFPAATLQNAMYVLANMVPRDPWAELMALGSLLQLLTIAVLLVSLMAVQVSRERGRLRDFISLQPVWVRWPVYAAGLISIVLLKQSTSPEFVYFQF
ncbi:MAG TPA: MBOAT family O-acyltransferase, partial [Bryobacteraceae bacterium]|nr:MBOAT family O-acyltransferase [Bryobacteraceae bacterium]